MKSYILIIITALVVASSVVYDSGQDIQRAMRTHRARRARQRRESELELFIDY